MPSGAETWRRSSGAVPSCELGERQPAVGTGRGAPRSSGVFSGTYRPAVARASRKVRQTPCARACCGLQPAPGELSLSRASRAGHTVGQELRRCTRNDGSMQHRWGGDRLAVPTGVTQRLLARAVGPLGCRRDAGSFGGCEPARGGSVFGVCGEPVTGVRYAPSAPSWLTAGLVRRLARGVRTKPRRTPARPAVTSARQVSSDDSSGKKPA